jgi:uncharacterized linocin/CFP29 family protein
MNMSYLDRDNTPLPAQIWNEIDTAALEAMRDALTARRFLDLEGPYGVGMTSLEVGADDFCREPAEDEASAVLSRAISVPMLRKNFKLSIRQVEAHLHMGQRFESSPIEDAAEAVARREEDFIYNGSPAFGVEGLLTARGRNEVQMEDWSKVEQSLNDVLKAVEELDKAGFYGPYALALPPTHYNNLFKRYEGTDMLQHDHLRRLCKLGIFKASIEDAVLVDARVGKLVVGQDAMTGYSSNDGIHYYLFISESIVPLLTEHKAICTLSQKAAAANGTSTRLA